MTKRSEIDSNFFIFALIICSIANGGVLAQSQEAYAIIQTCGQREFVDPSYCITLPTPPISCNLPQACYSSTGQPQDLKCQQLPDACLQKLQAAGIGGGGATERTTAGSVPTSTTAATTFSTTRPPTVTPPPVSTFPSSTPGNTFPPTRPPTPPPGGVPTQSTPPAVSPKNLVILYGYDSELGPPSIPTNLDGNFQQLQPPQSKGFQQPQYFANPQRKHFQPPQPQFQYKGNQGGFQQQRSVTCSDNYGACSSMANPAECGQAGSWLWQNCPSACGRC